MVIFGNGVLMVGDEVWGENTGLEEWCEWAELSARIIRNGAL